MTSRPNGGGSGTPAPGPESAAELWAAVRRILAGAGLQGILEHRLGPLAAHEWRQSGREVPPQLVDEERAAAFAAMSVRPLLERVRAAAGTAIVVLKGPELAHLYPGRARRFIDLDLLVPDAERTQRALLATGFVEDPDQDQRLTDAHHHLVPVRLPSIPLKIELHERAALPRHARQVSAREILAESLPSALGLEGVNAPAPTHHALILAAHGWLHAPLERLRDLVDVAAMSSGIDDNLLAQTAASWGMAHLWATTSGAVRSLFFAAPATFPLRTWARHLVAVRERTPFENHLERWLSPFSELPAGRALAQLPSVLREELLPAEDETSRQKLARILRVPPRR